MDLIVENGNKLSISSSEDLCILECVLTVVALSRLVKLVLRPDEDSMTSRADHCLDLLSTRTLDHELGAVDGSLVKVVEKHSSVVFLLSHDSSVLPSQQVKRSRLGVSWISRTSVNAVKLSIHKSYWVRFLGWFDWEFGNNLQRDLIKIASLIHFDRVGLDSRALLRDKSEAV